MRQRRKWHQSVDDSFETSSNEACDPVHLGTKYIYKPSPVGGTRPLPTSFHMSPLEALVD
jgi:hypothetical protein